ncbi:MAG TPA: V-type ATP synthase subunit D [Spirochaetia bacterium]|nr:V-type ATP synthase subunit D [Spirochaetia bacterium]
MALKYQFNKVSMQGLQRQLKIRESALPILKSKEAALRVTEKKQKDEYARLEAEYNSKLSQLRADIRLWAEFPSKIYELKEIAIKKSRIAGVEVPDVERIDFNLRDFSRFHQPLWVSTGVIILRDLTTMLTRMEVVSKGIAVIQSARRKTTQKVNLYEKVQIPAYGEAIRRIKRYLEDVANLDTAVQKITKQRAEQQELAQEISNG